MPSGQIRHRVREFADEELRSFIWARDEGGRGDVGGSILDRTDDDSTGSQASAITGKMSNRAQHQADIVIEEMHVPLENRLEQPRPFAETP